ncbi:MAG: BON domain-containing protein [Planctomycetaceae bacterium]|nr:BON domain-containing protein [Planctomycetaceae bacterium]
MIPGSSNTEVADSVRRSFDALHYPELKQVTCAADHGQITLQGRVRSYYLKQMAQEVAQRVPGVRRVMNNVQVGDGNCLTQLESSVN